MRWVIEADGEVIAETWVEALADAIFAACASVTPVVTMWCEPV